MDRLTITLDESLSPDFDLCQIREAVADLMRSGERDAVRHVRKSRPLRRRPLPGRVTAVVGGGHHGAHARTLGLAGQDGGTGGRVPPAGRLLVRRALADPVAAKAVLPTFVCQVRDDRMTYPANVQVIYDALPTEKRLHWIDGTTARWDGYLEFKRRPQPMLDCFARLMV